MREHPDSKKCNRRLCKSNPSTFISQASLAYVLEFRERGLEFMTINEMTKYILI
jgi:hypothetical protein